MPNSDNATPLNLAAVRPAVDNWQVGSLINTLRTQYPELGAADPGTLYALAQTGGTPDQVLNQAQQMYGLADMAGYQKTLEQSDEETQRSELALLQANNPVKYQALLKAGYKPPSDKQEEGWTLGIPDWVPVVGGDGPKLDIGSAGGNPITHGIGWAASTAVDAGAQYAEAALTAISRPLQNVQHIGRAAQEAENLAYGGKDRSQSDHGYFSLLPTIVHSFEDPGSLIDAWKTTSDGEHYFQPGNLERAANAVGNDPTAFTMAKGMAAGDTPAQIAAKEKGYEDPAEGRNDPDFQKRVVELEAAKGTDGFQQAYEELVSGQYTMGRRVVKDAFGEKVNFVSGGALANESEGGLLGYLPVAQFSPKVVSGAIDAYIAIKADPVLLAGQLNHVLRAGTYGLDIAEESKGVSAANEMAKQFREGGAQAVHDVLEPKGYGLLHRNQMVTAAKTWNHLLTDLADLKNGERTAQIMQRNPALQHAFTPFTEYMGNTRATVDHAAEFFETSLGTDSLLATFGGHSKMAMMPHITPLQRSMLWTKDFVRQGVDFMAEHSLDLHNIGPEEGQRAYTDVVKRGIWHDDEINGIQNAHALFADHVMRPVGQFLRLAANRAPISDGIVDLNDLKSMRALADTVMLNGGRRAEADAWFMRLVGGVDPNTGVELSNMAGRQTTTLKFLEQTAANMGIDTSSGIWQEMIHRTAQSYGIRDLDRTDIGADLAIPAALFGSETSTHMMVPSIKEMVGATRDASFSRAVFGTYTNSQLDHLVSRYWKPSVLMRAGFIPRIAGDESLRFILEMGPRRFLGGMLGSAASEVVPAVDELGRPIASHGGYEWERVPKFLKEDGKWIPAVDEDGARIYTSRPKVDEHGVPIMHQPGELEWMKRTKSPLLAPFLYVTRHLDGWAQAGERTINMRQGIKAEGEIKGFDVLTGGEDYQRSVAALHDWAQMTPSGPSLWLGTRAMVSHVSPLLDAMATRAAFYTHEGFGKLANMARVPSKEQLLNMAFSHDGFGDYVNNWKEAMDNPYFRDGMSRHLAASMIDAGADLDNGRSIRRPSGRGRSDYVNVPIRLGPRKAYDIGEEGWRTTWHRNALRTATDDAAAKALPELRNYVGPNQTAHLEGLGIDLHEGQRFRDVFNELPKDDQAAVRMWSREHAIPEDASDDAKAFIDDLDRDGINDDDIGMLLGGGELHNDPHQAMQDMVDRLRHYAYTPEGQRIMRDLIGVNTYQGAEIANPVAAGNTRMYGVSVGNDDLGHVVQNLTSPEQHEQLITSLHRAFRDAGADITEDEADHLIQSLLSVSHNGDPAYDHLGDLWRDMLPAQALSADHRFTPVSLWSTTDPAMAGVVRDVLKEQTGVDTYMHTIEMQDRHLQQAASRWHDLLNGSVDAPMVSTPMPNADSARVFNVHPDKALKATTLEHGGTPLYKVKGPDGEAWVSLEHIERTNMAAQVEHADAMREYAVIRNEALAESDRVHDAYQAKLEEHLASGMDMQEAEVLAEAEFGNAMDHATERYEMARQHLDEMAVNGPAPMAGTGAMQIGNGPSLDKAIDAHVERQAQQLMEMFTNSGRVEGAPDVVHGILGPLVHDPYAVGPDDVLKTNQTLLPTTQWGPEQIVKVDKKWDSVVNGFFESIVHPALGSLARNPIAVDAYAQRLPQAAGHLNGLLRTAESERLAKATTDIFVDRLHLQDDTLDAVLREVTNGHQRGWVKRILEDPNTPIDEVNQMIRDQLYDGGSTMLKVGVPHHQWWTSEKKALEMEQAAHAAGKTPLTVYDRWEFNPLRGNEVDDMRSHFKREASIRAEVKETAATAAINDVLPFVHNPAVRSQMQQYAGSLLPFWFAQEQFFKRWALALQESPELARKAQLYMNGIRHTGLVHTDPNTGQEVFVWPGSDTATQALGKAIHTFSGGKLDFMIPVASGLTTQTQFILPGLGELTDGTRPSLGPVAAVSLHGLASAFPEFGHLETDLLGEKGTKASWSDYLVPSHVKSLWDAAVFDADDSKVNSMVLQNMLWLEAHGEAPDATSSVHDQQEFIAKVKSGVRLQLLVRGVMGLAGPAAASYATQDALPKDLRDLLDSGVSMSDAMGAFLKAHSQDGTSPNQALEAYQVYNTQTKSPLPTTGTALAYMNDHPEIMSAYPTAAGWLMPQPTVGEPRATQAYYEQIAEGLRVQRTPREQLDKYYWAAAADGYFSMADKANALIAAQAPGSDQKKMIENLWKIKKDAYLGMNPVFAKMLNDTSAKDKRADTITELTAALASPNLPEGVDHIPALKTMIDSYHRFNDTYQGFDYARGTNTVNQQKQKVVAAFEAWADDFVTKNPQVRSFYMSVIRPDLPGLTGKPQLGEGV